MNRNCQTQAVVLKTRRFGDFHKSVTLLSPDMGIITATAHGAYKGKSRLSSITDPFCVSRFDLYYNPVKNSWKIQGCESDCLNEHIREHINAVYNASFWSEIILKSHASGADFEAVYNLFTESLECLNRFNDRSMEITVQFLLRFLMKSGFVSDFRECGRCGREITEGDIYYSVTDGAFECEDCNRADMPCLNRSGIEYFETSYNLNLAETLEKRVDLEQLKELRNILVVVLQSILEVPINTLEYIDYGME